MNRGVTVILLGLAGVASSAAFSPAALSAPSAIRHAASLSCDRQSSSWGKVLGKKLGLFRGATPLSATSSTAESTDTSKALKEGIANFYDQSSPLWEEVWGEHMHMGHYGDLGDEKKSDEQAQKDMIDRLLDFGEVALPTGAKVLDVGCGVGGSSRHIARRYPGCTTTGVTLSPVQSAHAVERSAAAGLGDVTSFQVADALNLPFEDNSFDLVWTLESGEHMPGKKEWLAECYRVLKPGGRFLMATWVHKETDSLTCGHAANPDLTKKEKKLLSRISKYYHLPEWVTLGDYKAIAKDMGFLQSKDTDWTATVAPFWPAVWRTALSWKGFKGLIKNGFETIRGARAVLFMIRGFNKGIVKLGLLTCTKPN
ncbi:S-adenosyl-L-methionine-dependent methyltransferase [Baffinella frigidus]|nr:S-adenosyl-L-methionine-dependent methyltransferase [Cryptophyta sp. CCMP2293]